jgi:hypothetical protein
LARVVLVLLEMVLVLPEYQGQIAYLALLLLLVVVVVEIIQKLLQNEKVKMAVLGVAAAVQELVHFQAGLVIHHQHRHHRETMAALMEEFMLLVTPQVAVAVLARQVQMVALEILEMVAQVLLHLSQDHL